MVVAGGIVGLLVVVVVVIIGAVGVSSFANSDDTEISIEPSEVVVVVVVVDEFDKMTGVTIGVGDGL